MDILLAYDSLSGNTREVAELIGAECELLGHRVVSVFVTVESLFDVVADERAARAFDLYLLGSWSDNGGRTPPEMKEFIAELFGDDGFRPEHVAVFGTGETQWGEEYYCGAVHRMARFFNSRYPKLTIEQMPAAPRDAAAIADWTRRIMTQREAFAHADAHTHHA